MLPSKSDGRYPAYTSLGGYPLLFYTADNGTLCPKCANGDNGSLASPDSEDKQWKLIACDVYWEGPPTYCDHCNCEIESAYGDPEEPEPEKPVRVWKHGPFTLFLWDANKRCNTGQYTLRYRFLYNGEMIFEGDDYGCSPMHAIDSNAAVAGLLAFLSLRPGDTDSEYFDSYTDPQLHFAVHHGEELSSWVETLESHMVTLDIGPYGTYTLTHSDGRELLIDTDWDWPATASAFGWVACSCGATDGTVDCPHRTASEMIAEAGRYLDDHVGDSVPDPGYFTEE